MKTYDIIIVGAGPGGLTAGIYAGRQGTKTLILDKGLAGGIGREVPLMENYPGFDTISGFELVEKMKLQCMKYIELHENEIVKNIEKNNDKYSYWSDVKYQKAPEGISSKELWCYIKASRRAKRIIVWKKYGI